MAPLVSVMAPKMATWPTLGNPDIHQFNLRQTNLNYYGIVKT